MTKYVRLHKINGILRYTRTRTVIWPAISLPRQTEMKITNNHNMRNTSILSRLIPLLSCAMILASCGSKSSSENQFDAFRSVIDTLGTEQWCAVVPIGETSRALLVTDCAYDNMDGNMASILASVYAMGNDGQIVCCGQVRSQGTAYPLAFRHRLLYIGGHRFVERYRFDESADSLTMDSGYREKITPGGSEYTVYANGDSRHGIRVDKDNALTVALDKAYARAKVIDFTPVEQLQHL